jgi:simple sugar transport system ATP-binding protein
MKLVELRSITKRFGNTIANDNIDFSLDQGEIHAILGENGAGKSTLMNILSGLYQPDDGKIILSGQEVSFNSPADAIQMGIGMIHQHFMLIQAHTALENIILGTHSPLFLNRKKLSDEISKFCRRLNFRIDPNAHIWQLSTGEQQRVEIIKALYGGANILILDEPTSVLTPQESNSLFKTLKSMRDSCYSIVFISHKLREVLSIADRITILRKGKRIDTIENQDLSEEKLTRMMIGRNVLSGTDSQRAVAEKSEEILWLENITARNNRRRIALDDVSLTIHSGEVLGIAGVAGNGQSELAEVISGLRKAESGEIYMMGKKVTGKSEKEIADLGVAYIPEDRVEVGTVNSMSIIDNILLRCYDSFSFFNGKDEIAEYSKKLIDRYKVSYSNLSAPVRSLSGGNLQKLILARELRKTPKLLIAACPTRGLDVGAIEYVRQVLLDCREKGSAILLISEDLDELLDISDRIAVMYEGKLAIMPDKNVEKIGSAMAGLNAG